MTDKEGGRPTEQEILEQALSYHHCDELIEEGSRLYEAVISAIKDAMQVNISLPKDVGEGVEEMALKLYPKVSLRPLMSNKQIHDDNANDKRREGFIAGYKAGSGGDKIPG